MTSPAPCEVCLDGWTVESFTEPQGWSEHDVQQPTGEWTCIVPCKVCGGPSCPFCGALITPEEWRHVEIRCRHPLCSKCAF